MSSSTTTPAAENANGRWLIGAFALFALLLGLNLLLAWRMDVFGILRNPKGRSLITSRRERKAKYLLNQAYVPANFDALVVGSSASVNWPMSNLTGYRFYNESLEGGNGSEERKLVDYALEHGHYRVALIGLYPQITHIHEFEDGLDQAKPAEALGSLDAYDIQSEILMQRFMHREPRFYPDGSHDLPSGIFRLTKPGDPKLDVAQDPRAVADYRGLVEDLIAHGVRIIYFYYPLLESNYQYNHEEMARYVQSVAQNMPSEPFIDFNSPEYVSFRSDVGNYVDGIHLSRKGAETLSRLLDQRIHVILQSQ
jgi:hypothetical protein